MSKMTTSGATGYFVEYAGEAIRNLSMEGRLTLCNLSIEMGARGGMIAPDEATFAYIKGKEYAPKGDAWNKALAYWETLKSDKDAIFDKEIVFQAKDIEPMITYGTNPGMGMKRNKHLTVVDKANVLASSRLWRQIAQEMAPKYAEVNMNYEYTDEGGYPYGAYNKLTGAYSTPDYNFKSGYYRNLLNIGITSTYTAKHFVLTEVTSYQHLRDRMALDQDFTEKDLYTMKRYRRQIHFKQSHILNDKCIDTDTI